MTVEEFLLPYSEAVRALVWETRTLVLSVMPDTIEQVDPPSKIIAYGFSRTYAGLICAIAPQKSYVNLMFSRGTELPDPEGLLEGTGKRARHVKLRNSDQVRVPALRLLLEAALHAMK